LREIIPTYTPKQDNSPMLGEMPRSFPRQDG
jgi:hypothetical protein